MGFLLYKKGTFLFSQRTQQYSNQNTENRICKGPNLPPRFSPSLCLHHHFNFFLTPFLSLHHFPLTHSNHHSTDLLIQNHKESHKKESGCKGKEEDSYNFSPSLYSPPSPVLILLAPNNHKNRAVTFLQPTTRKEARKQEK